MPEGIAKYIRYNRIEKAKFLLRKSNKSIEEFSESVGFLDANYFRRVFKEVSGSSTTSSRRMEIGHSHEEHI